MSLLDISITGTRKRFEQYEGRISRSPVTSGTIHNGMTERNVSVVLPTAEADEFAEVARSVGITKAGLLRILIRCAMLRPDELRQLATDWGR